MRDPFVIDEPTVISFSGGRTSAYMLWRVLQSNNGLPDNALVCFANTGKEDEATLQFVLDCETNFDVTIHWLELFDNEDKFIEVNFNSASRNGEPFELLINKKKFLPNSVMRFCTTELKINPITKFMKKLGIEEFDTMAGIRADEPKRVAKLRDTVFAPLAIAGVTQTDVQKFWESNNFDLGLKFSNKVTALGNCDLCFMKGTSQVLSIIREYPEKAVWWAKQEKNIGGRFSKDRPDYSSMINFTDKQIDMFSGNDESIACFCGD